MLSFIRLGKLALDAARETLAYFRKRPAIPVGEQIVHPFEGVNLLAPIPRPGKILCVGEKCPPDGEAKSPEGDLTFFAKFPSTVIGPGEEIIKPGLAGRIAFGVELGIVIGKRVQAASEEQVSGAVFGYCILNDVTACDQRQPLLGKNFDTFCPVGPCIVTSDDLEEAEALKFEAAVNGQTVQSGMIPKDRMGRVIAELTRVITLEPGDIVGAGGPRSLQFLSAGDELLLEVEGIGRLLNRFTGQG